GRKHVVVWSDAAPEPGRYRWRLRAHVFDLQVRNVIGYVDCAIDRVGVDAALKCRRQPARENRRAGYAVFPGGDFAAQQGRGNDIAINRTINAVLDVLLARPDHFHWPIDVFADTDGSCHHVGFEPAPEAAADEVVVGYDLLERKVRGFRGVRLHAADDLASDPHFTAISGDMNRAVQRLHRRVGQERHFLLAIGPVVLRQGPGHVADRFCDDAVFLTGGAQVVPNVAGVEFRVRAFVPRYGQRIESFFGSPHVIADDRYQVVEHNDLLYAG